MNKNSDYISQEQHEVFERYLLAQMSTSEEQAFLAKLKGDQQLSGQFDEFKMMFLAIEEEGLRTRLNAFHRELDTGTKETKWFNRWPAYAIAASLAILITIGGLWLGNRKSPDERIFNQYFYPDPGLPTVMGNIRNYDFYEAMVDYKRGNFEIAINKWEKLSAKHPDNDTLTYFLGSSYLAKKDTESAIAYFEEVISANTPVFLAESYYYLGMAHLKNGERDKAKDFLKKSDLPQANKVLNALDQ